ncbi:MAG: hypothetical protein ACR2RE_29060 [Geminicoccaceae bacterium]
MTTNPSLMPHLSWPKKVRDAHSRFLEAQRREKESLDAMDMLSVRVGHEGPSSAQHRTFMTAEGFVLTIESEAVLDVDPQRILLEADLGQESLEMARSKRRASFRGVALSPGLLIVRCNTKYRARIGPWAHRLAASVRQNGFKLDSNDGELIVSFDQDRDLDDQDLSWLLPHAEALKSVTLEGVNAKSRSKIARK